MSFLAVCVALSSTLIWAQGTTSGSVRGIVVDPDGLPTPGVTVIAKSEALIGGQQATVTAAGGVYRFPSLPPGMYELEASLPGFQNVLQQNVRVGLGQNLEIDLQLGNIELQDEILVVAESVQVSTVSNQADFNLAEDFIERQPVARDPNDLMNYAPGIENDQAYGAASGSQNAYNVDGVDVSDPELGDYWILPSMDWVQEVQVAGLGADAEYGGFTGAVVNLITKSGGNTFHGDLRAYYSGGSLNSDNAPPGAEGTNTLDSDVDVSASFGGPVVTDSLWYYVSGNRRDRTIEPFYNAGAPEDDRANNERILTRVMGKLTWQLDQSNRLMFLADWDDVVTNYRGVGGDVLASAAPRQESPNYVFNLSWESLITASSFLTAKITGFTGAWDQFPNAGPDIPSRTDRESGFDWQNYYRNYQKDLDRTTFDGSWSLFADGLLSSKDSHNFKFGVTYEQSSVDWITARTGGFSYYDDSWYCDSLDAYFDDPFCGVFSSDWGGDWDLHGKMSGLHAYAQDAWKIGNFALNAGVRFTQYDGKFKNASGTVYDQNMWAPRLGFVWDIMGNGKAALKAHYGRYYDGMAVSLYDREASGDARSNIEYFDYNFDTDEFDIPAGGSVTATAVMDSEIGHPYVDQFIATFEYQLGREMLFGIDYINRDYHDINAMVTSNVEDYDAYLAPDNPLGGGALPFFELVRPNENLITNPAEAARTYDSVALRVRKRYSSGWSLDASLVWSDLQGTVDFSYNGSATGLEDLNGYVNAEGTLPDNSEWVFKVSGSVDLPWELMLSGFYQYRTGEFWTPYVVVEGLYYNDRETVFMTPRGSAQYPNRSVLDLRLQKEFGLGREMSLALFVDAFNLLDSDEVIDVNERWGWYVYDYTDHPGSSFWDPSSRFEEVEDIQSPREIRIGARFSW
jgi:hypothetical protein